MFESFSKDEENVFCKFFPDSDEDERLGCVDTGTVAASALTAIDAGGNVVSADDVDCCSSKSNEVDISHTETIYQSSSHPINITLLERYGMYHSNNKTLHIS